VAGGERYVGEGPFARLLHTSRALTFQFVLTFAKVAAASDSLSFSAYSQNLEGPADALLASAVSEGGGGRTFEVVGGGDEYTGDGGIGEAGDVGEGGASIALSLEIPRQTVLARRAVSVFDWPLVPVSGSVSSSSSVVSLSS